MVDPQTTACVTTCDALVMNLRGLALRMQARVEAIEDRDGRDGAVTGPGVGIGYLLARDLAKNLSAAADMLDGGARRPDHSLDVDELKELDRLKWVAHEKECESAAMAAVRERGRKR